MSCQTDVRTVHQLVLPYFASPQRIALSSTRQQKAENRYSDNKMRAQDLVWQPDLRPLESPFDSRPPAPPPPLPPPPPPPTFPSLLPDMALTREPDRNSTKSRRNRDQLEDQYEGLRDAR